LNEMNRSNGIFEELLKQISGMIPDDRHVYLVGGAVRDYLLKRPIYDLDFTLEGDVRPLSKKVADIYHGAYYLLDEERNISRVILHINEEKLVLDFATLRAESLIGDLEKRDFTVNAIALDIQNPNMLIDPLHGETDLIAKKLRLCHLDSFRNDPVRVLRAIRLSLSLNFHIEKYTQKALLEAVPLLLNVSPERRRDEIFKIFELGRTQKGLEMLDDAGIMTELFPELISLKGITQSPPHVLDVWDHTLATLFYLDILLDRLMKIQENGLAINVLSAYPIAAIEKYQEQLTVHFTQEISTGRTRRALLLFSAMLHDIGKMNTSRIDESGRIRFIGHEQTGVEILKNIAERWVLSKEEVNYINQIIQHHMRIHSLVKIGNLPERRVIHRFYRDNEDRGIDLCILSLADILATGNGKIPLETWKREIDTCRILLDAWFEKKEEVVLPQKILSGNDIIKILNIPPGPMVGQIIDTLRETQAAGEVLTYDDAVRYIREWFNNQAEGDRYGNISPN
jgi:putative nucleotidyltransferase with HDIG domain